MRPQKIILLQGGHTKGGKGELGGHETPLKGYFKKTLKQSKFMIWVAEKHKTEEKL